MNSPNLNSLRRTFFFALAVLWITVSIIVFFIHQNSKRELALSVLDSAREALIVGDNRSAAVIINKSIPRWFKSVVVQKYDNHEIILNLGVNKCLFCIKLVEPIWFVEGSAKYGVAEFFYSFSYVIVELFAIISLSTIGLFLFYRREVRKLTLAWNLEMRASMLEAENNLAKQVSHDIRSPLSALNMILSLSDLNSEGVKEMLVRSSDRINAIARQLLSKSQAKQSDFFDKEIIPQEIVELIQRVVFEKNIEYSSSNRIKILFYPQISKIILPMNGLEFERLLSNILNNSIEAARDEIDLQVNVSILLESKTVKIIIEDNGIGIPQEIVDSLGRQKISYGKSEGASGFGLGIYHAYQAIHRMGGEILYQSTLGVGTTVTISFPVIS